MTIGIESNAMDFSIALFFAILGVVLMLVELVAPIGVFLFLAGAAAITSLSVWAIDLDWIAATSVYSVATLAALVAWYRRRPREKPSASSLNDRASAIITRQAKVISAITGGRGTVQIDDVIWQAGADCDIASGETGGITGVDGNMVTVRPA